MTKLIEKKPVLFAVIWILFYVALVSIGDQLSKALEVEHLVTSIFLIILAFGLYTMHKNIGQLNLKSVPMKSLRSYIYYLPLILLACIQFFAGIDPTLSAQKIAIIVLLMIGTGFVEEVLFRGLLFNAILGKFGMKRAVIVSGVTFGLGHIVNLLNGYSSIEQIGQIIVAVAIGIVLALLVALTNNLWPGIIFHILFNISGSVVLQDTGNQMILLVAILAITLPYGYMIYKYQQKEYNVIKVHS
jgi:hypothetical protein